jgi:hypothetical protein
MNRDSAYWSTLKEFATTDAHLERMDALTSSGNPSAAAKKLGISRTSMRQTIAVLERRAALQGFSPDHDMTHQVPDGFTTRGVSTLYNADGKVTSQWVKSVADKEAQYKAFETAVNVMCEDIKPRKPTSGPTWESDDKLLNLYTITDYHMGALAWHQEGGDDWDVRIATETLLGCFQIMIDEAPPAKACIINQLGDFLHYDSLEAVTPSHGFILDSDSRYPKVVEASIYCLRRLVEMALEQHEEVHLVFAEGNHDPAGSVWLRKLFAVVYDQEPRITVNDSEIPYYVYTHGETMIGFHHGHLRKGPQLAGIFAAQFPKEWGKTIHRYIHWGHLHSKNEEESNGAIIIRHPTLAAKDSYASRNAFFSQRRALRMTYHNKHGEVGTGSVTPEMLLA